MEKKKDSAFHFQCWGLMIVKHASSLETTAMHPSDREGSDNAREWDSDKVFKYPNTSVFTV